MKSWLLILGAVITLLNLPAALACDTRRIVCYFGSWAIYRPGNGRFVAEFIDPNICTHGIYAFVGLGPDWGVHLLDPWNDINLGGFRRFNELRNKNPNFKTLVAIGGWNEGSVRYSQMANDPVKRAFFVQSAVQFVKEHGFDGFDLDWEYPGQRGGATTDRDAFSQLLRELRVEFDKYGLLLTAAVAAVEASASISYNVPDLEKYLDFINVMTYDKHGSWDPVTGHNAPLFPGPKNNGFTVDEAIQYWIREGASREKITLGIGTYGRSFTLLNPNPCALGVPAIGAGLPGPYTREPGFLGYNEICDQWSTWNVHWDNQQKVPFACRENQFVGFDDINSTRIKSEYAVQQRLEGIMIWSVETDDFLGNCHGVRYPLLTEIKRVLCGNIIPPTTAPPSPNTTTAHLPTTTPQMPGETSPSCPTTDPSRLCTTHGASVGDPCDPQVFYLCIQTYGDFTAYRFVCGNGLVFDPSINACNWP